MWGGERGGEDAKEARKPNKIGRENAEKWGNIKEKNGQPATHIHTRPPVCVFNRNISLKYRGRNF